MGKNLPMWPGIHFCHRLCTLSGSRSPLCPALRRADGLAMAVLVYLSDKFWALPCERFMILIKPDSGPWGHSLIELHEVLTGSFRGLGCPRPGRTQEESWRMVALWNLGDAGGLLREAILLSSVRGAAA